MNRRDELYPDISFDEIHGPGDDDYEVLANYDYPGESGSGCWTIGRDADGKWRDTETGRVAGDYEHLLLEEGDIEAAFFLWSREGSARE